MDVGTAPDVPVMDAPVPMRDTPVIGRDATADGEDRELAGDEFGCILDWPMVRHFRVTNVLGHLDEALRVANANTPGMRYPVGTIIQVIPSEAMVKRGAGWNPATNDWEFIALNPTAAGTTIRARGGERTESVLSGPCFGCHSAATADWDYLCETGHGCAPLPFSFETIVTLQNGDPRCR
jgi:hypothetical protein